MLCISEQSLIKQLLKEINDSTKKNIGTTGQLPQYWYSSKLGSSCTLQISRGWGGGIWQMPPPLFWTPTSSVQIVN